MLQLIENKFNGNSVGLYFTGANEYLEVTDGTKILFAGADDGKAIKGVFTSANGSSGVWIARRAAVSGVEYNLAFSLKYDHDDATLKLNVYDELDFLNLKSRMTTVKVLGPKPFVFQRQETM